MRYLVIAVLSLVAAGTSLAQTRPLPYEALLRPDTATYHRTPIGLCEDYPEESTTQEIIRRDLELLKQTGTRLLRVSFGWDSIEPEKDRYDWLFWDEFVRQATDEYGITLIPYVCYTPGWNSTADDPDEAWHYPPKDYEEFGEFMYDLVSRYKDRIKTWELWNEPDLPVYWQGEQDEFARLVKAGSEGVRRADSSAVVVLGGISHDPNWLQYLFQNHDVSPYVDVVNMHSYFETWKRHPLELLDEYINDVDLVVERFGDGQPLWMAEVGYSDFRQGAEISSEYRAKYAYEHTPEFQAVHLVRTVALAMSTEKLSALAWYEVKDLPAQESVIGDVYNNRFLGIARADYTPKPAQAAYTFVNQLFSEPMDAQDERLVVEEPVRSDVEAHLFRQADGDVILVAWLATRHEGGDEEGGTGQLPDTRRHTARFWIPYRFSGQPALFNELGAQQSYRGAQRTRTGTRIDLPLEVGKVYVLRFDG